MNFIIQNELHRCKLLSRIIYCNFNIPYYYCWRFNCSIECSQEPDFVNVVCESITKVISTVLSRTRSQTLSYRNHSRIDCRGGGSGYRANTTSIRRQREIGKKWAPSNTFYVVVRLSMILFQEFCIASQECELRHQIRYRERFFVRNFVKFA